MSAEMAAGEGRRAGEPAPITVIRPQRGWVGLDLGALWEFRELLYFLLWRDLKVRYKQTLLGVTWAVLQPVITAVMFWILFGVIARLPSQDTHYFLLAYSGLVPWQLFASSINRSGTSLVSNSGLITKVYFPRMIIPLSAALASVVDCLISLAVLLVVMLAFGRLPGPAFLLLPLWILLVLVLALAVGLFMSALNVRYRDVSFLLSFLLQIWLYASPVAYSTMSVPEKWRWLYQLNPMTGLIEGCRWSMLGTSGGLGYSWIPAALLSLALFVGAALYFRQVERTFVDII